MIKPNHLQKGDTIILVSPAGKISKEQVIPTVSILESWGLKVKITPNCFDEYYRFSGTIEERLSDMQMALDDTEAKAILCNRGGYGCIHLINKLSFEQFKKYPKWLIGFSDISVFHSYFNRVLKCQTLHAPMPVNLSKEDTSQQTLEYFRKALFGESLEYKITSNKLTKLGKTEGELIGGNLATFFNILSTDFSYEMKNKILFIEDVGEPIHKIDQMMTSLKLSGSLSCLKGLIVGSFTDIDYEPEFGKSIHQIIYDCISSYDFPVIFDFPAGHISENYPLFFGRHIKLEVSDYQSFVII
ncbi:muramoyltetrapeptide carboxypeptidase [Balneicella halophila]|uniref:Muramoyltetrapeptide carboxypeptidase n=1 Tax=Balneicella halophila TaxID=1537566 RepID=A0A7L4USQ9_BALHA|nr:LD-carboxypeptidase [Balneicella halophila]PVX52044.1 muramoyltetrapeptide carboxypeptidase [Balneicella halophila]